MYVLNCNCLSGLEIFSTGNFGPNNLYTSYKQNILVATQGLCAVRRHYTDYSVQVLWKYEITSGATDSPLAPWTSRLESAE